jgi:hypothetical protein
MEVFRVLRQTYQLAERYQRHHQTDGCLWNWDDQIVIALNYIEYNSSLKMT